MADVVAYGLNKGAITVEMNDVTTAETVYVVMPRACTVNKIWSVILNAFITADNVVTASNHAGSSMGTITITQSGSAAGDVDSLTPSSNNTFAAGERLKLTSDGGGATATRAFFTIEYTVTA